MDMSQAYQAGVAENCRNAQVVFDKFHVVKNANEAVDQVRRAEVRLGGQGVWAALNKSQWLWRKNPENLTDQEQARLAKIKDKNLATVGRPRPGRPSATHRRPVAIRRRRTWRRRLWETEAAREWRASAPRAGRGRRSAAGRW